MHIQTVNKSQEQLGRVTTSLMENVSIIIPAFNEEKRIGQTISDLVNNAPGIVEIIVIFDGNDQTERICIA